MEPTNIVIIVFLIVLIVLLIGILIFRAAHFPVPSNQVSRNNTSRTRPVERSLSIREPVAKSKRSQYIGSKRPVGRLHANSNNNSDNNNIVTRHQIYELMRSNGMKRNEAMKRVEQMKNEEAIKHATINGGGTSEFHSRT